MHSSDINKEYRSVSKLIILDYRKNITFIYSLPYEFCNHNMQKDYIEKKVEEFMSNNAHKPKWCQWMFTKNEVIIK